MPRLTWDASGERFFETGVDRGVFYRGDIPGVAWNGLVSVSESPTGAEAKPYYLDGIKILNVATAEEFEATLQAFSRPLEFGVCEGVAPVQNGLFAAQQPRQSFGLSYRTKIGNDQAGQDFAYKIHLVYNALAGSAERAFGTISQDVEPITLSWPISTLPPAMTGFKPTAHLIIDSRFTDPEVLAEVEDLLYGSPSNNPVLPPPNDLLVLFA
jgi:hypothetical protein